MKTKQDNNLTNRVGMFYTENDIELSWLVKSSAVYEENQIG